MNGEAPIHIILAGQPFCGFVRTIADFPPGHQWVGPDEADKSNCSGCKTKYAEAKKEKEEVS